MPTMVKAYRVLVASPSDLEEERQVMREAMHDWNERNAEEYGIAFLPSMWEFLRPESGKRPQDTINERLGASDMLIGAFWGRIGTPTGEDISGTVEEIRRFREADKDVMLYFSKRNADLDKVDPNSLSEKWVGRAPCVRAEGGLPPRTLQRGRWGPSCLRGHRSVPITTTFRIGCKQLKAVRAFRKQFQQHSITGEFNAPDDLRQQLSDHLTQVARELRDVPLHNTAPAITPNSSELDRALFREIRELLPSAGSIASIRVYDYGGAFRREMHDDLLKFDTQAQGPEFEFMDEELEDLREQLAKAISDFLMNVGVHTYDVDSNKDLRKVPSEWRHENPKRHREAVTTLDQGADAICKIYDELIRLGRRKLGV